VGRFSGPDDGGLAAERTWNGGAKGTRSTSRRRKAKRPIDRSIDRGVPRVAESIACCGVARLRITAAGGGERKQILITRRVHDCCVVPPLPSPPSPSYALPLSLSLSLYLSGVLSPFPRLASFLTLSLSLSLSLSFAASSPGSLVSPCLPQP
jgi:hypothetical protein